MVGGDGHGEHRLASDEVDCQQRIRPCWHNIGIQTILVLECLEGVEQGNTRKETVVIMYITEIILVG